MQANGITIFDYKLIIQLTEAKKLLHFSNFSIEKIAKMLGFSSSTYFTKVFKKELLVTPHEYRRSFAETYNIRKQIK